MLESVCRLKRFYLGGKYFVDDEEVETNVRKRLRQQSKDFHAADFGALIKSINVGGRYVEKYVFYLFVTYLLTLPCMMYPQGCFK
jgi:hypothetical protein